ncbi:hypothetical protein M9H77_18628 [Catharanthus roseus]|uniref:Uncharacterized protein n=1 Tax=Catharanthus roseus TaxID=4058 RepID=A0ACC0B7Z9_CATRO|nr:hypothetical protein M9H77_18628 [Catharanthus roseus]
MPYFVSFDILRAHQVRASCFDLILFFVWLPTVMLIGRVVFSLTVSWSSAEAEYQSMAMILCELKWLCQLLTDLHVSVRDSIPLHCDNQATLYIAANLSSTNGLSRSRLTVTIFVMHSRQV